MRSLTALVPLLAGLAGCGSCSERGAGFCCLTLEDCQQYEFDEIQDCTGADEVCVANECVTRADASPEPDAFIPCTWTAPVLLPNVNAPAYDFGGSETPDGLKLFFTRTVTLETDSDIYVASRTSTTLPFGSPTRLPIVNTVDVFDDDPEVSATGLEMFFRRQVPESPMVAIWTATRTDPLGNFDPPQSLGIDGFSPSISGDGLTLYYVTISSPPMIRSITRSNVGGPWGPPQDVMSTEYTDIDVSRDELQLLVSDGPNGFPLPPVAIATRTDKSAPFGSPVPLQSLNVAGDTALNKLASWDRTERAIYATYLLGSGQGLTDIYVAACE